MPEIKFVGKPYEGKLHVRFVEGSPETGCCCATALVTYSTRTLVLPPVPLSQVRSLSFTSLKVNLKGGLSKENVRPRRTPCVWVDLIVDLRLDI